MTTEIKRGPGRPPIHTDANGRTLPRITKTIALHKTEWTKLKRIGNGNYTTGIRSLLKK